MTLFSSSDAGRRTGLRAPVRLPSGKTNRNTQRTGRRDPRVCLSEIEDRSCHENFKGRKQRLALENAAARIFLDTDLL
jgi:hypothetical protein